MQITDFEKQIQEDIDKDLNIRINPNHPDIAGVYWNDIYISVAVPPQEIREVMSEGYVDGAGYQYRSIPVALELIKGKLKKYKQAMIDDPELLKPIKNEKDLPIKNV